MLRLSKWVASSSGTGGGLLVDAVGGAPEAAVVAEVEEGLGGCGEGGDGVLCGRDHCGGGASVERVGGVAEGASSGERTAVEVDGAGVEDSVGG